MTPEQEKIVAELVNQKDCEFLFECMGSNGTINAYLSWPSSVVLSTMPKTPHRVFYEVTPNGRLKNTNSQSCGICLEDYGLPKKDKPEPEKKAQKAIVVLDDDGHTSVFIPTRKVLLKLLSHLSSVDMLEDANYPKNGDAEQLLQFLEENCSDTHRVAVVTVKKRWDFSYGPF